MSLLWLPVRLTEPADGVASARSCLGESPDGQMIAFERDDASGQELHVMNADGSRDRSLTRNGVWFVIPFAWSPALPKRR